MSEHSAEGGEGRPGPVEPGGGGEDDLPLEARLRRLEEIVGRLEADEVELEESLALFEEGVRHIRLAEALLARAELRVQELVGEGEALELRDLDEEGDGDG